MRDNIYELFSVKPSVRKNDLTKIIHYLNENDKLFLNEREKVALFKERSLSTTPMSLVFNKYNDTGVYDNFSFIAFPARVNLSIPESLTYKHVVCDTLQIMDYDTNVRNTVRSSLNLRNKIVENVTQLTKTDGRYYYLRDHDRFQSTIVRDCLSRSYYAYRYKNNWIRTSVATSFAKIYTLLLSSTISRIYDLKMGEQDYVTLVFASFFINKTLNHKAAKAVLSTKHREFYLRDRSIVIDSLNSFKDIIEKDIPDTLDECFSLIESLGIPRLKLNRSILVEKLRTTGGDILTTGIALEYPPYFIWAILNSISGAKNQLYIFIKNQNLMKEVRRSVGEFILSLPELN